MWHFGLNCIWLSLVICNSLITHYFDAVMRINSLVTGRFYFDFRQVIFKLTLMNGGWDISYEIALRWMPLDLIDDKSTLVQVMTWCRQATSHYLSQCWPRSMSPNGVTRPQWVKETWPHCCFSPLLLAYMYMYNPLDLYNIGPSLLTDIS